MMPKIEDLLFGIREYDYLTKIDISMQYYSMLSGWMRSHLGTVL